MDIKTLVQQQRNYFNTNQTKEVSFRKAALKKLRKCIMENETLIEEALYVDLHKSKSEAFMSEVGMVLAEITYQLRHIDAWTKPQKVRTPLAQFPSHSYRYSEPYGVVLVMSPWNYPFQLSLEPCIGAIAAGNCVILKPSAYAKETSKVIAKLMKQCFHEEYVAVVEGGRSENTALLEQRFDYIFFTGGVNVGRIVMEKASKHLTPISLELGGKSPCIVDKSANLKLAAKRIVFGKFLNAGQTCVAPDYVFVDKAVSGAFKECLQEALVQQFGKEPLLNKDYPCIINHKHFLRLQNLMKDGKILIGGKSNAYRQIEPTILGDINKDDNIMQEEIFGPILPILEYSVIEEAIRYISEQEAPLACYVFSNDKVMQDRLLRELHFGGGCINDTIIHLATSYMGFGGVGQSGMGSYHGYDSFTTFSHFKSIVHKANWLDLPFRYQPYTKKKDKIIRLFMK